MPQTPREDGDIIHLVECLETSLHITKLFPIPIKELIAGNVKSYGTNLKEFPEESPKTHFDPKEFGTF